MIRDRDTVEVGSSSARDPTAAARRQESVGSRAAPDGYTLGVGNWARYVAASATYPVHYDLLKDLAPVAKLADTPLWIVARTSLPVNE
jgi:tripartite tricarboxylate transporter family receptor